MPDGPLFIIGCPRSGTTLLAELLQDGPWGLAFESHFIPKYAARLAAYDGLESRVGVRRLVARIQRERPVDWLADAEPGVLALGLERAGYAALVDRLCARHPDARGPLAWADKTPHYVTEVALLRRLWPGARFVYVYRDGRDVACSLLRKSWGPANVIACARLWARLNSAALRAELALVPGLLTIGYESLVARPAEVVAGLAGALGWQPDEARLRARTGQVSTRSVGRWRAELSAAQVRDFEAVAGACLRELGYATAGQRAALPAWRLTLAGAHDRAAHLAHLVYMNSVEALAIRLGWKARFDE